MFSVDYGKLAPCLVLDKLLWGHGKIDIVVGVDGGLGSMGLRPNREHDFKVIKECPVLK